MKTSTLLFVAILLLSGLPLQSQTTQGFPVDPYQILKRWSLDDLLRERGDGDPIHDTVNGKVFVTGVRYSDTWFRRAGNLDFYFTGEKVSRLVFRHFHPVRSLTPEMAELIKKDTAARNAYTRETSTLDSLRRDSVIRDISAIMGSPLASGRTTPADRYARHSANWTQLGFSCFYKDYVSHGELTFTLSSPPSWIQAEYGIPGDLEIVQQGKIETQKMAWTYSLLAKPSDTLPMGYDELFILMEYENKSRYLEKLPETTACYLPLLSYEDANGDGIPDAWIRLPMDPQGRISRHYIYSQQFREPILIFDTEEFFPEEIKWAGKQKVSLNTPSGEDYTVELPAGSQAAEASTGPDPLLPAGYSQFTPAERNRDGSLSFHGRIPLIIQGQQSEKGCLDILYAFTDGGWEIRSVTFL